MPSADRCVCLKSARTVGQNPKTRSAAPRSNLVLFRLVARHNQ